MMILSENSVLEFVWPWSSLFWIMPIVIRIFKPSENFVRSLRVPFYKRITGLPKSELYEGIKIRTFLFSIIIWSFFVIAAMRPQWVGEPTEIAISGRSVMIAVDLSGSMKEKDLKLNGDSVTRLEIVKSVLRPFIERRKGDRLGLILFGSQAYLQTPLTFDIITLTQMLEESEIGIAGERTAIGNAIGLAIKKMKDLTDEEKVLILLTDGQNTAGEVSPEDAGLSAKNTGIKIHTIGIGADEVWVSTLFGKQKVNPSIELDEFMLKNLSKKTGGTYFRARNKEELERIYEMIDKIEPIEKEKKIFRPRQSLFFWPLGIGVLSVFFILTIFYIKKNIIIKFNNKISKNDNYK